MNIYPPRVRLWAHSLKLFYVSGSFFLVSLLACLRLQGQACNDLSVLSLGATCSVLVTPDMVLEGTYDDSLYAISLTTLSGLPVANPLTLANLGDTLRAKVTDTLSGNSCWGLLVVEDHLSPAISCSHITLPCALPEYTPAYLANLGVAAAFPAVVENCGAFHLSYVDTWVNLDCGDLNDRSAYIERVWTAADGSGNKSSCTQYLNIRRLHVSQLSFPNDTVISCKNPLTAPAFTGQPFYAEFGVKFPLYPDQPLCGLNLTYSDQILPLCSGSYNILRTWVVLDNCLLSTPVPPLFNPFLHIQVIQVSDKQGPSFVCPKDTVVYTGQSACARNFDLPDVLLSDDCSQIKSIRADWGIDGVPHKLAGTLADFPGNNWWTFDTLAVLGLAENLPVGIFTFRYTVTDDCGNTSTCSFRVTVSDGLPPLVACDEFTQVGLGTGGMTLVNAATFNDGSYDNCSPVLWFKARRVEPNGCQPNDQFYDQVKFCCADAGDTVAVILRVYDLPVDTGAISLTELEDHGSDCLVYAFVDDKLKPLCVPPLNQTVSCLNFDPSLTAHGTAAFADNCCLDTAYELPRNYSQFDTLCNRGTIVRTFRAVDCNGLSSQCTQRLIVTYEQNYAVKFPDDIIVYDCDTTGVYGPVPEIYGKDCEYIAISYEDVASTGGIQSCYWIERRWMIIDWCTYNPNLPLVEVPNPNPVADPSNVQNLLGPTVAPPGHQPPATIERVTSTDVHPTDFSQFWSANVNGYLYRQFIIVRDNVPPKIRGCPALDGPVEFCDLTKNDPQFWHENYWIDPVISGSTDLCEGITDLAVTASDGCSKGNVSIRYLLFLDLNGDGTPETVINSVNPPPVNTVFYNNAMTPNFTGGEARAFDERPVPQEEKYRFAIQISGYVNRTAWVRWVSEKDPAKFVIPQLPHGQHRIMWIIEDGCGNETRCEYPIRVRDCRNPDLICINGLSTDIMQTKHTNLWASDFLLYTDDNCTPAAQVRIGIRKSGTGTGFPFNPDGSPQTGVSFTCDDLGVQPVELWSIDAAGNFNVCETYVLVQDNFSVCPNTLATLAGLIQTEDTSGLEGAHILLEGTHPALPAVSTFDLSDLHGFYYFSNALPFGGNYTLTPLKDNDPLNGVSTFDLVRINQHILGLKPLDSPYKMIAADINNSRSITTFDIIELRKLILGVTTDFADNTSWRFIDKSYLFPNPSNPFQEIFPETIQVADLQSSVLHQDFVAVKVGDVNGNAIANSLTVPEERSASALLFDVTPLTPVPDGRIKAGQLFTLHFSAAECVSAYQFTLYFPELELINAAPGPEMTSEHFGIFPAENALTTSFDNERVPGSFAVTFRARQSGLLRELISVSGRITKAEAYPLPNDAMTNDAMTNDAMTNDAMTKMTIALRFTEPDGSKVSGLGFELYQNQPNPWRDKTQIRFYLPATIPAGQPDAGAVRLTVFDGQGNELFVRKGQYAPGYHSITLDHNDLPAGAGVLYYRLETEFGVAVREMVVVN